MKRIPLRLLLVSLLFVFIAGTFSLKRFVVVSNSMNEFLYEGDHILCLKAFSKNWIDRRDVIVFMSPIDFLHKDNGKLIKRSLFMPGDTIWDKNLIGFYKNFDFDKKIVDGVSQSFLVLPSKKSEIKINLSNLGYYYFILKYYEEEDIKIVGEDLYLGGKRNPLYCFKNDYFFGVGDNRDKSKDSRTFGPIADILVSYKMLIKL